jgi:hypothetical protein
MTLLRKYIRQILLENVNGNVDLRSFPEYDIGKPVNISKALKDPRNTFLRKKIYDIVKQSYSKLENSWYEHPDDLIDHNMNAFLAYDITGDGYPNVIFAGWVSKRSSYGMIKTSLSGTDSLPESIAFYKKELVRRVNSGIAFHEVSGAPAAILMKAGLEAWDKETVINYFPKPKKVFYGKHPRPNHRDAKNAMIYSPDGKYDKWFGRALKGSIPILKLFFGKKP